MSKRKGRIGGVHEKVAEPNRLVEAHSPVGLLVVLRLVLAPRVSGVVVVERGD